MKNIIIAVAILGAAFAQAATVTWESVAMYNSANKKVGANATMYVYMIDEAAYNALTDVWAEYGSDVLGGGAQATAKKKSGIANSKVTIDVSEGIAASSTYYAAIIATVTVDGQMQYYAEKGSATTGEDGNGGYTFGAGKLNTAANAATAWASAEGVPEPTSGLLLLVGGALLALRRKQK